MNNTRLAQSISQQLAWLNSWKQPQGYGGPVIHYWKDSLYYTGPGLDWRYEGIIIAFLQLYKKTGQKEFLQQAIEAGDHLVHGQLRHGQFLHSGFDGNPSGPVGSMPHDTAASIGLMRLGIVLHSKNNPLWKKYFAAAEKNLAFHQKYLYDRNKGLFLQTFPSLDPRRHFVPNKHATLAELLMLFYTFTKEKKYLQTAEQCIQFVISQQDHDQFKGGIHQTDKNHSYIAIYIARCISGMMAVYNGTKKAQYLKAAVEAGEFLQTLKTPEGGFYFGWRNIDGNWHRYKYPQFVAGAGDILRAFVMLRPHKKYPLEKHIAWIDKHTHQHGGVWTSRGMNLKNEKEEKKNKEVYWRDVIPVVGWNDKILRLRVELLQQGAKIKDATFIPVKKECADGTYEETKDMMKITTKKQEYIFHKDQQFSRAKGFFQPLFALRADKYIPPYLWEKIRRVGQGKSATILGEV